MSFRAAAGILMASACLLLTACGGGSDDSTLTLAESKSQVQLLRNEVASRLPSNVVHSASNSDFSKSCSDDESIRSWHSSVMLEVDTTGTLGIDALVDRLSTSFEEDGWVSTPGNERVVTKQAYFTGGASGVEIQVTVLPSGGEFDQIFINVFGACVQTDGLTSDEVTSLERLS